MSLLYSDDKRDFLICSNREERLRFNMDDITQDNGYNERLHNFGVLHPYSLLIYIICGITVWLSIALIALSSVYSHNLIVPAGYLRIVWFLKKQNQKMVETLGVQKHRQRNIVSIGCITKYYDDIMALYLVFNLLAWGLDLAGDILGLIFFRSDFLLAMVFNLGIPAGLAPLVYLYGAKGILGSGSRRTTVQISQKNEESSKECLRQ